MSTLFLALKRSIKLESSMRPSVCYYIVHKREAHTDIKIPDFNKYRRDCLKDPTKKSENSDASRKVCSYTVSTVAATMALYGVKSEIMRYDYDISIFHY